MSQPLTYNIVFPPYTGGNHLLNLFLTGAKFKDLISATYKDDLLKFYTSEHFVNTAHFFPAGNNPYSFIKRNHISEILNLASADTIIENTKFILLTMPPPDKNPVTNRINSWGSIAEQAWFDQMLLYKIKIIQKLLNVPASEIIELSSINFNTVDTTIFDILNTELDIELPVDFCQFLHNIWIDKIYNE